MKMITVITGAVLTSVVAGVLLLFVAYTAFSVGQVDDEDIEVDIRLSSDLDADKVTMWNLVGKQVPGPNGKERYLVAPISAINAASRVMESERERLIGLTKPEVFALLKHREEHRAGSYNFPFWSPEEGESGIVLRFDCGRYGWQFDLYLDENERVKRVYRRWIH